MSTTDIILSLYKIKSRIKELVRSALQRQTFSEHEFNKGSRDLVVAYHKTITNNGLEGKKISLDLRR